MIATTRTPLLLAAIVLSLISLLGCAATSGAGTDSGPSPGVAGDWLVAQLGGKSPVGDSEVALTFGSEGEFAGTSGVNRLRASYTLEGDDLQLSAILATRRAGPPELMEQEARLMAALEAARGVRVSDDGELQLLGLGGEVLLAATRQ